ncbi:MAG: type II toxin-antitoxin system VapC family toxin [Saprospiraceae bacterium]|nr:type II toxin-antitoxin system VapC family toxin [Saprospiraceae bacterium]
MRYLLDSHTLLWFSDDAPELSPQAKSLIVDESVSIAVSMASFWEISIKNSLGKLRLDAGFEALMEVVQKNGFDILPVGFDHVALVNKLPFHHGDPFDRMLIAQALSENMDIIGIDKVFDQYLIGKQVKRTW